LFGNNLNRLVIKSWGILNVLLITTNGEHCWLINVLNAFFSNLSFCATSHKSLVKQIQADRQYVLLTLWFPDYFPCWLNQYNTLRWANGADISQKASTKANFFYEQQIRSAQSEHICEKRVTFNLRLAATPALIVPASV